MHNQIFGLGLVFTLIFWIWAIMAYPILGAILSGAIFVISMILIARDLMQPEDQAAATCRHP